MASPDGAERSPAESVGTDSVDSKDDAEVEIMDPTGRFVRRDMVGSGAFKNVYRAFDTDQGIEVAWNEVHVKLKREMLMKIESEIRILEVCDHPHLINIIEHWEDPNSKTICFITNYMNSGTLKEYVKEVKKVKLKVIRNWCRQILEGLNYLHTRDPPIIHRDLKCDNIFMNGNRGEIKIGDLGLSTVMQDRNYAVSLIGTPEYMAPELYDECYTVKADIYSFGMCVLEMCTGDRPYRECTSVGQIIKKVQNYVLPLDMKILERSADLYEFVSLCFRKETERPAADSLLLHPFLVSDKDDDVTFFPGKENPNNQDLPRSNPSSRRTTKSKVESTASISSPPGSPAYSRVQERGASGVISPTELAAPVAAVETGDTAVSSPPIASGTGTVALSPARGDAANESLGPAVQTTPSHFVVKESETPGDSYLLGKNELAVVLNESGVEMVSATATAAPVAEAEVAPVDSEGAGYLECPLLKVKGTHPENPDIVLMQLTMEHDGVLKDVHFEFNRKTDTCAQIAEEMVAALELNEEVMSSIEGGMVTLLGKMDTKPAAVPEPPKLSTSFVQPTSPPADKSPASLLEDFIGQSPRKFSSGANDAPSSALKQSLRTSASTGDLSSRSAAAAIAPAMLVASSSDVAHDIPEPAGTAAAAAAATAPAEPMPEVQVQHEEVTSDGSPGVEDGTLATHTLYEAGKSPSYAEVLSSPVKASAAGNDECDEDGELLPEAAAGSEPRRVNMYLGNTIKAETPTTFAISEEASAHSLEEDVPPSAISSEDDLGSRGGSSITTIPRTRSKEFLESIMGINDCPNIAYLSSKAAPPAGTYGKGGRGEKYEFDVITASLLKTNSHLQPDEHDPAVANHLKMRTSVPRLYHRESSLVPTSKTVHLDQIHRHLFFFDADLESMERRHEEEMESLRRLHHRERQLFLERQKKRNPLTPLTKAVKEMEQRLLTTLTLGDGEEDEEGGDGLSVPEQRRIPQTPPLAGSAGRPILQNIETSVDAPDVALQAHYAPQTPPRSRFEASGDNEAAAIRDIGDLSAGSSSSAGSLQHVAEVPPSAEGDSERPPRISNGMPLHGKSDTFAVSSFQPEKLITSSSSSSIASAPPDLSRETGSFGDSPSSQPGSGEPRSAAKMPNGEGDSQNFLDLLLDESVAMPSVHPLSKMGSDNSVLERSRSSTVSSIGDDHVPGKQRKHSRGEKKAMARAQLEAMANAHLEAFTEVSRRSSTKE